MSTVSELRDILARELDVPVYVGPASDLFWLTRGYMDFRCEAPGCTFRGQIHPSMFDAPVVLRGAMQHDCPTATRPTDGVA